MQKLMAAAYLGSYEVNFTVALTSTVVDDGVAGLIPTQSSEATNGSNYLHDFCQGEE